MAPDLRDVAAERELREVGLQDVPPGGRCIQIFPVPGNVAVSVFHVLASARRIGVAEVLFCIVSGEKEFQIDGNGVLLVRTEGRSCSDVSVECGFGRMELLFSVFVP